jgi:hypothetical protein
MAGFRDAVDGLVRIIESGYTQKTAKLLGRTSPATGAIEEIGIGSGLTLTNKTLDVNGAIGLGTVITADFGI